MSGPHLESGLQRPLHAFRCGYAAMLSAWQPTLDWIVRLEPFYEESLCSEKLSCRLISPLGIASQLKMRQQQSAFCIQRHLRQDLFSIRLWVGVFVEKSSLNNFYVRLIKSIFQGNRIKFFWWHFFDYSTLEIWEWRMIAGVLGCCWNDNPKTLEGFVNLLQKENGVLPQRKKLF